MKKLPCKKNRPNKSHATSFWIFGKHAVIAALLNPKRKIHKIYLLRDNHEDFISTIKNPNLHKLANIVTKNDFNNVLPKDSLHQGYALLSEPLIQPLLEDILLECRTLETSILIILDQANDTGNIGAVLRSALAFSVAALILPKDNSPQENGVMSKAACGALEHLPLVYTTNLITTINFLKKQDFWIFAMDGSAKENITKVTFPKKTAIIIGSEGKGIRPLILKNSDIIMKIEINVAMESLNMSTACAIALFEISKAIRK